MRLFRILLAVPLLVACQSKSNAPEHIIDPPTFSTHAGDHRVVLVDDVNAGPKDPATIQLAKIEGDTLRLDVQHGGGCRQHEWQLLAGTAFMESHPVQVGARLAHDGNGDSCKALVSATLRIDLTPLKARYQQSYQTTKGSILINLAGAPGQIRYDF